MAQMTALRATTRNARTSRVNNRKNWPYLANLAAAGFMPEDIDYVLCTHLHADHVGWNTRLVGGRWVPTFPNARYLVRPPEMGALAGGGIARHIHHRSVL